MKKQWIKPEVKELGISKTEAAIPSSCQHDGYIYHTDLGDFEGHGPKQS